METFEEAADDGLTVREVIEPGLAEVEAEGDLFSVDSKEFALAIADSLDKILGPCTAAELRICSRITSSAGGSVDGILAGRSELLALEIPKL